MRNILVAAAMATMLAGCEVSFNSGNNGSAGGGSDNAAARSGNAAAPFAGSTRGAARRFVNSPENATSPALRQHYVDFSFDYPSNWVITPQPADGSASNYVRVAAPMIDNYEPFAFHVGHSYGSGNAETDARDLEAALPNLARQFGSTIPDYWVTSMGRDRVGAYDSWTWRFSATAPSIRGSQPARVYGRGDLILPPGATKGVLLMTLVTDRTDEVSSPAEVGETGTIKAIFDSFRLGPSGTAK